MPETQDRRFQIITIQRYKRDLKFPNFFCTFFIENEAFKGRLVRIGKTGFGERSRGGL